MDVFRILHHQPAMLPVPANAPKARGIRHAEKAMRRGQGIIADASAKYSKAIKSIYSEANKSICEKGVRLRDAGEPFQILRNLKQEAVASASFERKAAKAIKEFTLAKGLLERASQNPMPEDKPALFKDLHALGDIWHSVGIHEGAKLQYSALISLNPDDPAAYNNLGVAKAMLENTYAGSLEYFRAASGKGPSLAAPLINIIAVLSGIIYQSGRGFVLKEDRESMPKLIDDNEVKAYVKEAFAAYNKLLMIDPNDDAPYINIAAFNLFVLGKEASCRGYYEKAISAVPSSAHAHALLGLTYEWKEDRKKALECYMKAFELDPADELASGKLQREYSHKIPSGFFKKVLSRY
ncbi:MAG: hypothetical protein WC861_01930 [Candidatus Micrarchaeia archaeon]